MHKMRVWTGGLLMRAATPLRMLVVIVIMTTFCFAGQHDDAKVVEDLDIQYQQAVKNNDVKTMDRILADDFVLVTGNGKVQSKADLLKESGSGAITYERQEDSLRTVRVWRDTAVVTALLWVKGVDQAKTFDYKLWFSDVYVRTAQGWKYVFGQASLRLPPA
ncbi:MAG TPA: nuclear transport factor 2 family protein [Terriglobales bacterium]|nr:nuclear transport factor 2 family protein [Terriglobales bacterium]